MSYTSVTESHPPDGAGLLGLAALFPPDDVDLSEADCPPDHLSDQEYAAIWSAAEANGLPCRILCSGKLLRGLSTRLRRRVRTRRAANKVLVKPGLLGVAFFGL